MDSLNSRLWSENPPTAEKFTFPGLHKSYCKQLDQHEYAKYKNIMQFHTLTCQGEPRYITQINHGKRGFTTNKSALH